MSLPIIWTWTQKKSCSEPSENTPGTILLVSHDPMFYEDFITRTLNVKDWTTKII